VVQDDVVNPRRVHQHAQAPQELVFHVRQVLGRLYDGNLVRAAHQIGIVAGAVVNGHDDIKDSPLGVLRADPVDAIGDLDRIHAYTPGGTRPV
jgi:hypothetical protein